MLSYIKIKNIALIEEVEIDLNAGLNILTGETGVGKSIIINSINFALGERIAKDIIRKDAEFGYVELIFNTTDDISKEIGENYDLELDSNELIISRKLHENGKNMCKINGETVTLNMLKGITEKLIDVHGQHEHQSLMDAKKHLSILDKFCEKELSAYKTQLSEKFDAYTRIKKQIAELMGNDQDRERKIDLLKFQIDEITGAKLIEKEEEELNERRKILSSSDKLMNGISKVYKMLYDEPSVVDCAGKCLAELEYLAGIDEKLNETHKMLTEAHIQLEEVASNVREYAENIEHDPRELEKVEKRLDVIHNLKRKYGSSITEILSYHERIQEELDFIEGSEEKLEKLRKEYDFITNELHSICEKISVIRKNNSEVIKTKIEEVLRDLEMKNIQFGVKFDNKQTFDKTGFDNVEFLFSANKGERLKALDKIASGGEMSRVMLAIKTVLANTDNIGTLIFDEIDTGISGITAQKVAEKMALIAKTHQILCITHLPQIAAMADYHYNIIKETNEEKTVTNVEMLDNKNSVREIARLITGAETTELTIKHAEEMKQMATKVKEAI